MKSIIIIFVCSLMSISANASTIFNFSGNISFEDDQLGPSISLAQAFGITSGTTGTFSSSLIIDDNLFSSDAERLRAYTDPTDLLSDAGWFNYQSLSFSIGSHDWTHSGTYYGDDDYVYILDGVSEGSGNAADAISLSARSEVNLSNGYKVSVAFLQAKDDDYSSFGRTSTGALYDGVSTSAIHNWNDLKNTAGHILLLDENNAQHVIRLSDISMTITSGVPEPSTWLMMIVGFGFASAASRRRKLATV